MSDISPAEPNLNIPRLSNGASLSDAYVAGSHYASMLMNTGFTYDALERYAMTVAALGEPFMPKSLVASTVANAREGLYHMRQAHLAAQRTGMRIAAPFFYSQEMAQLLWEHGCQQRQPDKLAAYNNDLYTHNSDGTLNMVNSDHIVKHFAPEKKHYPLLILTANHALSRDGNDLSGIMHNINSLIRHTINRDRPADQQRAIPFVRFPNEENAERKVITLAALHTEDNAIKNSAALLNRFNYLNEHTSLEDRIRIRPRTPTEEKYFSEQEWNTRGPSPAAIRLAKLMLKAMLEEPNAGNTGPDHSFVNDTMTFSERAERGIQPSGPLILRADAAEIADHFVLIGYSKAANTVTDAVRYLMYELTSRNPDGSSIFQLRNGGTPKPVRMPEDVYPIINRINILAIGGAEVPLTEEECRYGMRRQRINNINDYKSIHFLHPESHANNYQTHADRPHLINGTTRDMGHGPNDALGFQLEEGYVHADETAFEMLSGILKPRMIGMAWGANPSANVRGRG